VVAHNNIRFALCEILSSPHKKRAPDGGQKNAHPNAGDSGKPFGFLRVAASVTEQQERDQYNEQRNSKYQYCPQGENATGYFSNNLHLDAKNASVIKTTVSGCKLQEERQRGNKATRQ
jgi:hypothetical protein